MSTDPGNLPSPQSDVSFLHVDPEISLQNQARLQERERRKNANPPTNADGKYICVHPDPFEKPPHCSTLVFDRKCEWNKHMDKHDRPFRCEHPDCAKLQGFTYPGGLARHEKEVHGKHGGPTAQHVCPFSNCKRSRGKKFTRKENLEEHIKRCHTTDGLEEEEEEAEGSTILDHPENSVASLLVSQQQHHHTQYSTPTETANTMQPSTNNSLEPDNIDPAIAAAHDTATLNAISVEKTPQNGRKRKAASNYVFKSSPYETANGQPNARGRRRKLNPPPDLEQPVAQSNVFEELDRLRTENARLQMDIESRNARISTLEDMIPGFAQHQTA